MIHDGTTGAGAPYPLISAILAEVGPAGIITAFGAKRVLVLAPHMDDEALGCAGTLAHHVRAGAPVTVAYMTDGRLGATARETEEQRAEITATRKREARAVGEFLRLDEQIFVDAEDGALTAEKPVIDKLAEILGSRRPEIVYAPSLLDGHTDHWQTNRILSAALERVPGLPLEHMLYRGYEVWGLTLANTLVDISETWPQKTKAMSLYESQQVFCDFQRTITALNTYRSQWLGGHGYAEAFFQCPLSRLPELVARVRDSIERWHAQVEAIRGAMR